MRFYALPQFNCQAPDRQKGLLCGEDMNYGQLAENCWDFVVNDLGDLSTADTIEPYTASCAIAAIS